MMTFDEALEYAQDYMPDLDTLHLVIDIINELKDTYEPTINEV